MNKTLRTVSRGADELGWRAAADQCEEQGDDAGAALWRARADALAFLVEMVQASAQPYWLRSWPFREKWTSRRIGAGAVVFRRTRKMLFLRVYNADGERAGQFDCMRRALRPGNLTYLRSKAFEVAGPVAGALEPAAA